MALTNISGPPDGYHRLPAGHICKCLHMWSERDGIVPHNWCCGARSSTPGPDLRAQAVKYDPFLQHMGEPQRSDYLAGKCTARMYEGTLIIDYTRPSGSDKVAS